MGFVLHALEMRSVLLWAWGWDTEEDNRCCLLSAELRLQDDALAQSGLWNGWANQLVGLSQEDH